MSHIQQDKENDENASEDAMKVIEIFHLDGLKWKKTQAKATCTRTKRKLKALMHSDLS